MSFGTANSSRSSVDDALISPPSPESATPSSPESVSTSDDAGDTETPVYDPWWTQPFSFLGGGAGTGKTFAMREWAAEESGVVLCATTGIAAINLGGTTINGYLGYYDTASLRDSYVSGFLGARLTKLKKAGLRRIVLDEVSMLDGEQLTIFTKVLDELAGIGYGIGIDLDDGDEEESPEDPVHPVGLTLVGDFAQLPPVKAPFAFESSEWPRYEANQRLLTEIRRQADQDFVNALWACRRGDGQAAVEYFAERMVSQTDPEYDGPTLLAKNEAVWRFNDLRLSKLDTPRLTFKSTRWIGEGRKAPSEWQHIPEVLPLKEQALVMILANARDPMNPQRFLYVNGDLADLLSQENDVAVVRLRRTGEEVTVLPVTRTVTIPLEVGRRKRLKAEGLEDRIQGRKEIVGAVTYMPLRLAWATTVHKSQGLSLDQVQVNINDGFFKTPGMLYVSLSRARSVEGLQLVGSPSVLVARCTIDERIRPWL